MTSSSRRNGLREGKSPVYSNPASKAKPRSADDGAEQPPFPPGTGPREQRALAACPPAACPPAQGSQSPGCSQPERSKEADPLQINKALPPRGPGPEGRGAVCTTVYRDRCLGRKKRDSPPPSPWRQRKFAAWAEATGIEKGEGERREPDLTR